MFGINAAMVMWDNARALTTSPRAPQQQQKDSIGEHNVLRCFAVLIVRRGEFASGGRPSRLTPLFCPMVRGSSGSRTVATKSHPGLDRRRRRMSCVQSGGWLRRVILLARRSLAVGGSQTVLRPLRRGSRMSAACQLTGRVSGAPPRTSGAFTAAPCLGKARLSILFQAVVPSPNHRFRR